MKDNDRRHIVSEGYVNAFLIPGVLLAIPAIIFLMTHIAFGVVLSIVCVILFSAKSGLELNSTDKTFRKYHSFFGIKIGKNKSWIGYDKVKLVISSENQYFLGYKGTPYFFGPLRKTKSLTYDIWLTNGTDRPVRVYDFLTYRNAAQALSIFAALGMETEDRVMDKLIENRKRRR